jgi:tetratricopeptide (TPR) repeat protein
MDPNYEKARVRLFHELSRLGEKKHVKHGSDLHGNVDILLAISDALENCFDELIVQREGVESKGGHVGRSAADLKKEGNTLFSSGRHSDGMATFLRALQLVAVSDGVALLLSNRAICYHKLEKPALALLNALAAIACDPRLPKAHFHHASALSALQQNVRAVCAIACSLQLQPGDFALTQLKVSLVKDIRASSATGGLLSGASAGGLQAAPDSFIRQRMQGMPKLARDGSQKEEQKMSGMSAKQMQAHHQDLERKLSAGVRHPMGIELMDRRIPPFHLEFASAGLWPAQCNIAECEDRLLMAYESARSTASWYNLYLVDGSFEPKHFYRRMNADPRDPTRSEVVGWFARAREGEMNLDLKNQCRYDPRVLHVFANAANRSEAIAPGSTTVSVGFVDLGFLLEARLEGPPSSKPTRWVGYEATAYCVAKTAVVIGMLRLHAPVDTVLQVWYSAAWSSLSLVWFRRAIAYVLEGTGSLSGTSHPDVRVLLQTWQSAKVTLEHARRRWVEGSPDTVKWRDIGNFRRVQDRTALCAYALSGQLLDATVGSVVMYALPGGYLGGLATDARVFETITFEGLMDRCLADGSSDIVTATVAHLREGIGKLFSWVGEGRVEVDVRLCAVEPEDRATLSVIAALAPDTMTWSNVGDYCSAKDFHAMARACSGSATVHHAYSMNWPLQVFGVKALDLMARKVDPARLARELASANAAVKASYEARRWTGLLLHPPVEDPRNLIDCALASALHAQWVEAYFAPARLRPEQVQVTEVPGYRVLVRALANVGFTFTY